MCKAVMPSSPQRFPTPANRGDNTRLSTRRYRWYSHVERLPTADKESSSHLQPLLSNGRPNCTRNYSHHGMAGTVTLRGYRPRTRKVRHTCNHCSQTDGQTAHATTVIMGWPRLTAQSRNTWTTISIVTQLITDYFHSHTVNKKRLCIPPHSK